MKPLDSAIRLHVLLEPADQAVLDELSRLLDVAEDEALRLAIRAHLDELRVAASLQAEIVGLRDAPVVAPTGD